METSYNGALGSEEPGAGGRMAMVIGMTEDDRSNNSGRSKAFL